VHHACDQLVLLVRHVCGVYAHTCLCVREASHWLAGHVYLRLVQQMARLCMWHARGTCATCMRYLELQERSMHATNMSWSPGWHEEVFGVARERHACNVQASVLFTCVHMPCKHCASSIHVVCLTECIQQVCNLNACDVRARIFNSALVY
jgi:hypothetical protein